MYLFLALQGQGESAWPGSSGAPTEWTHLTNSTCFSSMRSRILEETRVMIIMFITT